MRKYPSNVGINLQPISSHTRVALQVTEKLLAECDQRHLQLIADSYLDMLHMMLESSHSKMRIMATNSVSPALKYMHALGIKASLR